MFSDWGHYIPAKPGALRRAWVSSSAPALVGSVVGGR